MNVKNVNGLSIAVVVVPRKGVISLIQKKAISARHINIFFRRPVLSSRN
jgi:hypothetical protein